MLVTLGTDLKVILLHPLLRNKIPLPPMLTISHHQYYDENCKLQYASEYFIEKVVISSKIPNKNTVVMDLYGGVCALGFALGDKVWTDVNIPSASFHDTVYHDGNCFIVDCHGGVFVCGVDDDKQGKDIKRKAITKLKNKDWHKKYLVELSSGSGLLLLVRYRKDHFPPGSGVSTTQLVSQYGDCTLNLLIIPKISHAS